MNDTATKIILSILVIFAGLGVWHVVQLFLKRDAAAVVAARSFESWADELYSVAHELLDADMNVARCEAKLMKIIGTVPPETSYQMIRRIGLGRQMETAILLKLEQMGLGERLPAVVPPQASVTPIPLAPVSRRRPQ